MSGATVHAAACNGDARVLPDVLFLHLSDEESSVRVDNPVADRDRSVADDVRVTEPPPGGDVS